MQAIDKFIHDIAQARFFCAMGEPGAVTDGVVYVESVSRIFVAPHDQEALDRLENLVWLPTSPTQEDPFNQFPTFTKELTDLQLKVNKAVMQSIKQAPSASLIAGAHDSVLLPEMRPASHFVNMCQRITSGIQWRGPR
ncbi:hypothetical protein ACIPW4_25590 [Pseudomonas sp. NPDC089996]|uniref:hypothetical protein n=1 Tax=Pseudomonas sp. NPDC089996 TaxID=3364474 RepID=UPI0037F2BA5D